MDKEDRVRQEENNKLFDHVLERRWLNQAIKIARGGMGVSEDRRNKLFDIFFRKKWYDKAKKVAIIGVSADRKEMLEKI